MRERAERRERVIRQPGSMEQESRGRGAGVPKGEKMKDDRWGFVFEKRKEKRMVMGIKVTFFAFPAERIGRHHLRPLSKWEYTFGERGKAKGEGGRQGRWHGRLCLSNQWFAKQGEPTR